MAASHCHPEEHIMKLDYERIALVLQGGGALGSYQCGVYEGLQAAGIPINWVAGVSIGAINAALIAGNEPQQRRERLSEFWDTICRPSWLGAPSEVADYLVPWPADNHLRGYANLFSATRSVFFGQRGFFTPRPVPPWAYPPGGERATSFYDNSQLKATLLRLIDFDLLNSGALRLSVGAVNIRTGNLAYFDTVELASHGKRIGVEHIMAACAWPPAFAAVEIDGELFWDGGIACSTPLEFVLDARPQADTLAFQVDVWSARGKIPNTIVDVLERQKDIQYSSRTRRITDQLRERHAMRRTIAEALARMPDKLRTDAALRELAALAQTASINVIQLIYESKWGDHQDKDYEFKLETMREHWGIGLRDVRETLAEPERLALQDGHMATHDVHRGT